MYLTQSIAGKNLATCLLLMTATQLASQCKLVAQTVIPTQNLNLWLKADAGVTKANNRVSAWASATGTVAASQVVSSLQPTYIANSINGQAAVQFDGADDSLDFTLPISGSKAQTIVIVSANVQNQTGGNNGSNNSALSWDESSYWGSVYVGPFQSAVSYRFGTGQTNNLPTYNRPASLSSNFSSTAIVKNGATESLYVNGVSAMTQTGKLDTIANVSASAHLGKGYAGYFSGQIAEVLVYSRALSSTELTQVQSYLQTKYFTQSTTSISKVGLGLWLKADAGISSSGSSVSRWSDQSGSGNDAYQATAGNQPTAVAQTANNMPAVHFNGANRFLNFNLPVSGLSGMTIMMVSSSGVDTDGGWNGTDAAPLSWNETADWGTLDLNPLQRAVKYRFGTGQANNLPAYNRPASIGTNFSLSTVVKDAGTENLYVNGQAVFSQSGKMAAVANVSSSALIGKGNSGYFVGDVSEILVYTRALSSSERQAAEAYLLAKYGMNSTLPPAIVTPVNAAPAVSAGSDQTVTLPAILSLSGTATDDGLPSGALTTSWSFTSGPGTVTFGNPAALTTNVAFPLPGSYVLRLTASDGSLSSSSNVTVTVVAAPVVTSPLPIGSSKKSTYSTADTVYPANIGYYNVRKYGAKGDGITDDTAAIRQAIQDALAGRQQPNHGAGGRNSTVYFPAGTYSVTDTLIAAQYGNGDAEVTAQIDPVRGCVTGFTVLRAGSGYGPSWSGGPALYLTGGGGSGVEAYTTISNGSITGVRFGQGNKGSSTCAGHGYTSVPKVTVQNWRAYLRFEGQNKDLSIIRLKDNTAKFSNANCNIAAGAETGARENCPAVVYFANEYASNSTGFGEDAYMNDFWNLTINTGYGNPGAIALDWLGSNRASVKNVNLISGDGAGRCGLSTSRSTSGGPGPAYVKNVTVIGFDYGIDANVNASEVGNTFEYIDVENQRIAGIFNANAPNWFRGVSSTNSVPALIAAGAGSVTIIDGQFHGGSPSTSAILNRSSDQHGVLFARNIASSGYASALALGASDKAQGGSSISEYAANSSSLFPSTMTSLGTIAKDAPEFVDNNFADWADVSAFGAQPNTWQDVTPGIQAAMNSGRPVVYFPYGEYKTSATIHIPSTVRKIVGANSAFAGANGVQQKFPFFSCDSTSGNSVEIRNMTFDLSTVGFPTFQNNCSSDLVIADVFNANGYVNTALGTGDLYFENAAIPGGVTVAKQNVWARQLDIERGAGPHLTINYGKLWLFGYKTEGATNLLTGLNATVEVLGAFHSNNNNTSSSPGYVFTDSLFSLADVVGYGGWPTAVSETRNGVSKVMGMNGAWQGGFGLSLMSGH